MQPTIQDLENKINELEKKIENLSNPATIPENFLTALVQKGFIRYDNTKILTYTNVAGKDFWAIFAKYGNENTVIAVEDQANFLKITSINTSTDVLTVPSHGLSNGDTLYIASTNQFPGGLNPQFLYTVTSATTDTIKLLYGGSPVNITSVGAGASYIRPQ